MDDEAGIFGGIKLILLLPIKNKTMANTVTKEIKVTQTEHNPLQDEAQVQSSIASFFNKLTETIDQLGKNSSRVEDLVLDKRFEFYSQAYQGFAQNNVSKPEGFSLKVNVDQNYNNFLKGALEKEKQRKLQLQKTTS